MRHPELSLLLDLSTRTTQACLAYLQQSLTTESTLTITVSATTATERLWVDQPVASSNTMDETPIHFLTGTAHLTNLCPLGPDPTSVRLSHQDTQHITRVDDMGASLGLSAWVMTQNNGSAAISSTLVMC